MKAKHTHSKYCNHFLETLYLFEGSKITASTAFISLFLNLIVTKQSFEFSISYFINYWNGMLVRTYLENNFGNDNENPMQTKSLTPQIGKCQTQV